jgi:predicted metal-dependent hydrolase
MDGTRYDPSIRHHQAISESHYVWGKRYLLNIIEHDSAPSIELKHSKMILQLRPDTNVEKKEEILDSWYREILKQAAEPLIAKWENLMGVKVEKLFLQRMKTKWGSCNHEAKNIRINTELAKKPPECLEYIVVHELVHLIEPTHNDRFIALMNQFMPKWRMYKDELNRLPVRHEEWGY